MPLEFYKGDILELDVDAVVIPHLPHDDIILPEARHIMNAACKGYIMQMMYEYENCRGNAYSDEDFIDDSYYYEGIPLFGKFDFPEITILNGYDLKAEHTIHVCVEGCGDLYGELEDDYEIQRCYIMALNVAKMNNVRRIAIPLLGTGVFGFSFDQACSTAKYAVERWFADNKDSDMTVCVVLQSDKDEDNALPLPDFGAGSVFFGYAERMAREIARSRKNRDYYFRDRVEYYLMRCQYSDSELEILTGFDHTTIGRLRTGKTSASNKRLIIALAVCMGLRGYEFYEFVVSAALGHNYPSDSFDKAVETVLATGAADFRKIDAELCKINPEFSLTKPERRIKNR